MKMADTYQIFLMRKNSVESCVKSKSVALSMGEKESEKKHVGIIPLGKYFHVLGTLFIRKKSAH